MNLSKAGWLDDTRTLDVDTCWLRRRLLIARKTTADAHGVITTLPLACPFSAYL
jgi:hypothetical protein